MSLLKRALNLLAEEDPSYSKIVTEKIANTDKKELSRLERNLPNFVVALGILSLTSEEKRDLILSYFNSEIVVYFREAGIPDYSKFEASKQSITLIVVDMGDSEDGEFYYGNVPIWICNSLLHQIKNVIYAYDISACYQMNGKFEGIEKVSIHATGVRVFNPNSIGCPDSVDTKEYSRKLSEEELSSRIEKAKKLLVENVFPNAKIDIKLIKPSYI